MSRSDEYLKKPSSLIEVFWSHDLSHKKVVASRDWLTWCCTLLQIFINLRKYWFLAQKCMPKSSTALALSLLKVEKRSNSISEAFSVPQNSNKERILKWNWFFTILVSPNFEFPEIYNLFWNRWKEVSGHLYFLFWIADFGVKANHTFLLSKNWNVSFSRRSSKSSSSFANFPSSGKR